MNNNKLDSVSELRFSSLKRKNYLLTLIIPTYNRPEKLNRALNSIEELEYSHEICIMIIDNGSNILLQDRVIDAYCRKTIFDCIYFKNIINLGWSNNFNLAVKLSNSNYVCFLHDDDEITSKFNIVLKRKLFLNNPATYFFHYFNKEGNNPKGRRFIISNLIKFAAKKRLRLKLKSALISVPSFIGAIYEREVYLGLGGLNESEGVTADYDLTIRLMKKYKVYRYSILAMKYNSGENSTADEAVYSQFNDKNYLYRNRLITEMTEINRIERKIYTYLVNLTHKISKNQNLKVHEILLYKLLILSHFLNFI